MRYLTVFFIITCNIVYSQNFSKTYSGTGILRATGMLPTADGGALFACKPNGTFLHVILTKVDSLGEIQWTRQISQTGSGSASNGIKETGDGNYLFSLESLNSNSGSNGGGGTLVKLNSVGDTLWARRYSDNVTGTKLSDIILTADSNYILFWGGSSYEGALDIVKMSPYGNIIWSKHYSPNSNFTQLNIVSGTELDDGSLAFSGVVVLPFVSNTEIRSAIIKLDVHGNLIWSKYYDVKNNFEAIFKHGNEIRILSRPLPSLSSRKMSYLKVDEYGVNFKNYSDTTNSFVVSNLDDKKNFSNQINDSMYQITLKNYFASSSQSFIIQESGASFSSFNRYMGRVGGNIYTSEGYYFLFGSNSIDNPSGLQLIKTIGNNEPCDLISNSLNWVSDTLISDSNLPLTSLGNLSPLNSLITLSSYQFSVDDGCVGFTSLEETPDFQFNIYPNPSRGYFHIESKKESNYTVNLYNFLGVSVKSSKFENINEVFNVAEFLSGFYTLIINDEDGRVTSFKIQIIQ